MTFFLFVSIVPATPTSNVYAVYNMHVVTGALQIIQSTWNEVVCILVILTHLFYILHTMYWQISRLFSIAST